MYIRWLQYGVFQPVYRPHAQEQIAPEPVFHDKQTQDIIRQYIKLRYQLLPYNYSLAVENSLTGMPLMRPMLFEDDKWLEEKSQYLWGDSFLVKPVTDPGVSKVDIDLPEGGWFDFWSGKYYSGNEKVSIETELTHLPVLVRAGSFIPMVESVQTTRDYSTDRLDVHYYAHPSVKQSEGVMYDDDGKTPDTLSTNQYQTIQFNASHERGDLLLGFNVSGDFQGAPESRTVTNIVHNWQRKPSSVSVNDVKLNVVSDEQELASRQNGAFWDKKRKSLKIKFTLDEKVTLKIN